MLIEEVADFSSTTLEFNLSKQEAWDMIATLRKLLDEGKHSGYIVTGLKMRNKRMNVFSTRFVLEKDFGNAND